MILVPLFNPKFAPALAARSGELRVRGTSTVGPAPSGSTDPRYDFTGAAAIRALGERRELSRRSSGWYAPGSLADEYGSSDDRHTRAPLDRAAVSGPDRHRLFAGCRSLAGVGGGPAGRRHGRSDLPRA